MKLKMESAAAETTTKKISPRLPPSLVFAAAVVMMIAAIAGLITLYIEYDCNSIFIFFTCIIDYYGTSQFI
jgi:hypothetical protein